MKILTEYEKYKILRPLFNKFDVDSYGFPIMKKDDFSFVNWNKLKLTNLKNIKNTKEKDKSIVIMFTYDMTLNSLWNDPLKKIPIFKQYLAVCTPDFSIYPNMNINDIRYNVYRNRWFGCMLQERGIKVIPTIQWATKETYDICFSGIEKESIVIISTLGCHSHSKEFLEGFCEMQKRIQPTLIIVYGRMIRGMYGRFLQFDYEEAFNEKKVLFEQMTLFDFDKIFEIRKEDL